MTAQDIKDTLYATLRERIATLNPARTLVLRGALRPALLVAENELVNEEDTPLDCYNLHWTVPRADLNLIGVGCEIHYATEGSSAASGMDRGRLLAEMDAELLNVLQVQAQHVDAFTASEASAGTLVQSLLGTRVFWSDITLGATVESSARLTRTANLEVFGYA